MNLPLLNRIFANPWAIQRDHLTLLTQLVIGTSQPRRRNEEETPAKARAATSQKQVTTPWGSRRTICCAPNVFPLNWEAACACDEDRIPDVPANVTVILIWGVLGRAWSGDEKYWLDAIEVDEIIDAINEAPPGNTIVLWFRSPGGITAGIPETAAAIRALARTRKIVAWTDDLCASAAMWLAAQCNRIDATPTAAIGSIGVYIALYDFTEYLSKQGVSLELFKAGRLKAMGLPGNPLSPEEAALLQASVDEVYKQFTGDVLKLRAVPEEAMQGQTFRGKAAKDNVLVDGFIVNSAAYFATVAKW